MRGQPLATQVPGPGPGPLATALAAASLVTCLAAACGGREHESCVVHCSTEGLCPEGLVCQQGWCASPGTTCADDGPFADSPPLVDAPGPSDASSDSPSPDAMPCVGGDIAIEDPSSGHCYLVFTSNRTWTVARDNCVALSMHLATLSTLNENVLIRSGDNTNRWIGLNDIGPNEGIFVWVNAEPLTFTNWNGGEPNNANDEDCVGMLGSGQWNDFDCGEALDSVCERP